MILLWVHITVSPDDRQRITIWGDLAEIGYEDTSDHAGFISYAAYTVPVAMWVEIIAVAREIDSSVLFFGEGLGAQVAEVEQLWAGGFDLLFNSTKGWDSREGWLLEQHERIRHSAPSIAFPESHDTARLERGSGGDARDVSGDMQN